MSKANQILLERANDLTFIKYITQFFNYHLIFLSGKTLVKLKADLLKEL